MDPKDKHPKNEYLKDKQTIIDNIRRKYAFKINKIHEVKAVRSLRYELNDYRSSRPYFTGNIYFEEGGEWEASFFTFKESEGHIAKKIYSQASKLTDDGILKPWFITYHEPKKIWILCYDKFDSLLSDDDVTNVVLLANRGDSIRKLLRTVKYIHGRRLFHGALKERCNYVIISGEIKIIFGSSLRTRDDLKDGTKGNRSKYRENLTRVENTKMKDLTDLKDMLKEVIVAFKVDWEDQNSFFKFFDNNADFWNGYDGFIDHLINHPSLMSCGERIEYLSKIEHAIETNTLRKASLFINKLEEEEFSGYLNWNRSLSRAPRLRRVYEQEGINYNGKKVRDLIRFLANAYVHYRSPDFEKDLDLDVRRLYPDFLNRMHKYL